MSLITGFMNISRAFMFLREVPVLPPELLDTILCYCDTLLLRLAAAIRKITCRIKKDFAYDLDSLSLTVDSVLECLLQ